jgi:hypothetical protein
MMIAPAFFRLAVTGESHGAILSLKANDSIGIGLTLDIDVYLDSDGHALELARRGALR